MPVFKTLAFLCIALAAAPARADSFWLAQGALHPECTCRAKGANVALGSLICLVTANGLRTAECVMEQNNTSWRISDQPCPEARLRAKPALAYCAAPR